MPIQSLSREVCLCVVCVCAILLCFFLNVLLLPFTKVESQIGIMKGLRYSNFGSEMVKIAARKKVNLLVFATNC